MKSASWYVHVLGKKRQKWGGNRPHVLTGRTEELSSVCSRGCALKGLS